MSSSIADHSAAPVITIDGPTASGKGTVAQGVADVLGWAVLDSGALYRLTALSALEKNVETGSQSAVAALARTLDVDFRDGRVCLEGRDVTDAIRHEDVGNLASRIAAYPSVREALLQRQRDFRHPPGVVADGRDMGTIVFPDAPLKIFLVADPEARAKRRCKQLIEKGISANISRLIEDMRLRDLRDRSRALAPLVAAPDAHTIDSSDLSIEDTVRKVLDLWSGTGFPAAGAKP